MNMIKRTLKETFCKALKTFPAVTLTGPRQSGKTTLAKEACVDFAYVNLESPDVLAHARTDPRDFLALHKAPVIFDEVQNVPELLSYLQPMIDESRLPGQYVLTGSQQFGLMAAVKQSLAGRTAVFSLAPLSIAELSEAKRLPESRDSLLFKGFMPGLYAGEGMDTPLFYSSYYKTYIERDVSQLKQVHHRSEFDLFVRLLAGRVGQLLNLNSLSDDVGVSSTTLREWLSLLETSHIVYLLHPFYRNIGKRLIKSPKIYFYEPGLVAWLLGARHEDEVALLPQLGGLFENMVVMEAVKCLENKGEMPALAFYRDSQQREVDLVIEGRGRLIPVEIKSARTYSPAMSASVKWFAENIQGAYPGFVVYSGETMLREGGCQVLNYVDFGRTNFEYCRVW